MDRDINNRYRFTTEELAYWFFRLNGCMCLVNFLVHQEQRGQEGTDVDIMAVRFPYRRELANSLLPMEDHQVFAANGKPDLIITEVKRGLCNLNGPWTNPARRNMERVLDAIGAFLPQQNNEVAKALYEQQFYEDERYRLRMFALGERKNDSLPNRVVQLTWDDVLRFIHNRFCSHDDVKRQHQQWDGAGKKLFRLSMDTSRNQDEFVGKVLENLDLSFPSM